MDNKTIIAFDIESTGTDVVKDRICSLSMIKLSFPSFEIIEKKYTLINPLVKIPEGATEVHGITDEMVKDKPTFKQISKSVFKYVSECDYLLTHNGKKFDRSMLHEEFFRCELDWNPKPMIDTYVIMSNMIPRTLAGALKYYTGKEIENAHNAEGDVLSTIEVLKGQIEKHEMDELDIIDSKGELISGDLDYVLVNESTYDNEHLNLTFDGKIKLNKDNIPVWNFGKNQNNPVLNDLDYCSWVLRSDFPANTKQVLSSLLNKR
jgi:DNA polymerase-3 subunit epsilon